MFSFLCKTFIIVNTNNNSIMAVVYVPDNLVSKIFIAGADKQSFVKEAIEEKLLKSSKPR